MIDNADLVVEQVNPLCGDEVTFYFKLQKDRWTKRQSAKGYRGKFARDTSEVSSAASGEPRLWRDSSEVEELRIADVSFTGSGCAISIASASILSENIKGKSLKSLSKITGDKVLEMIGGSVTPARLKCVFLPLEALYRKPNSTL